MPKLYITKVIFSLALAVPMHALSLEPVGAEAINSSAGNTIFSCSKIADRKLSLVQKTKSFRLLFFSKSLPENGARRYRISDTDGNCKFEFTHAYRVDDKTAKPVHPDIWNHAEVTGELGTVDVGLRYDAIYLRSSDLTRRFLVPVLEELIASGCDRISCWRGMTGWISKNSVNLSYRHFGGGVVTFIQVFYISGEVHTINQRTKR